MLDRECLKERSGEVEIEGWGKQDKGKGGLGAER
jgi:hypothetical protein